MCTDSHGVQVHPTLCEADSHAFPVLHAQILAYSNCMHHAVQYKENMELRMKHASTPEKFMASELDLDEEVRRYDDLSAVHTCGPQSAWHM